MLHHTCALRVVLRLSPNAILANKNLQRVAKNAREEPEKVGGRAMF
jgi:hypothetical protein